MSVGFSETTGFQLRSLPSLLSHLRLVLHCLLLCSVFQSSSCINSDSRSWGCAEESPLFANTPDNSDICYSQHWEKALSECVPFHLVTWARNLGTILDSFLLLNPCLKGYCVLLIPLLLHVSNGCFSYSWCSSFHSVQNTPAVPFFVFDLLLSPSKYSLPCHYGDLSKMHISYCNSLLKSFQWLSIIKDKGQTPSGGISVLLWSGPAYASSNPATPLCQFLISTHIPNSVSRL